MKSILIGASVAVVLVGAILGTALAYPDAKLAPIKGDIIFNHELHVIGNGVECSTCHASVDTSKLASDYNLPSMDVCSSCHEQVSQDTACGMCHRNAIEPSALPRVSRPIVFSHAAHIGRKTGCNVCHAAVETSHEPSGRDFPVMADCMNCHDGAKAPDRCALCHEDRITLGDIHPPNWRMQHADAANRDKKWCQSCHRDEESCVACHRGDNTEGKIHGLNYSLTHGVDAKGKVTNCLACHDSKTFCNDCHVAQLRMPLNHSLAAWRTGHAQAAREDIEDCQSCHDSEDPTCARVGCHHDGDGVRGTDPSIHEDRSGQLGTHGPWHDDDGYFCFQCHVNTRTRGQGFCGYCHGAGD